MKPKTLFFLFFIPLFVFVLTFRFVQKHAPVASVIPGSAIKPALPVVAMGVWISVFDSSRVLYSKQAADDLLAYCRKNAITDIYLQIYRSGIAYYQSAFTGDNVYDAMVASFGEDPVAYLLARAAQQELRVHAWINVLSLAKNQKAPILREYGTEVLTRDRQGRSSIRTESVDKSDQYYLRDDQIFLEPGEERVTQWMLRVVDEIVGKYPGFSGIHLDYIRYPYPVPFIPDSRFSAYGISYGYGEGSLRRFMQAGGKDPVKADMFKDDFYLQWDNWKRDQITGLLEAISRQVKVKRPQWLVSCAVVPAQERAYAVAYQDWPLWLDKGLVDYIVLMNYSKDRRLALDTVRGGLTFRGRGKIYAGLGAFLAKAPEDVTGLAQALRELGVDGLVWFAYEDLLRLGISFQPEAK